MKNLIAAALVAALTGCNSDAPNESKAPSIMREAGADDYLTALETYRAELEILDHMEDAEAKREEVFDREVHKIVYESGLSVEDADTQAMALAAESKKERLAAEAEIEKQRQRVERAKAELDAVEKHREQTASGTR